MEGADALVLITEWNEFRALDLARVKSLLRAPVVIDLRNIYQPRRDGGGRALSITASAAAASPPSGAAKPAGDRLTP